MLIVNGLLSKLCLIPYKHVPNRLATRLKPDLKTRYKWYFYAIQMAAVDSMSSWLM